MSNADTPADAGTGPREGLTVESAMPKLGALLREEPEDRKPTPRASQDEGQETPDVESDDETKEAGPDEAGDETEENKQEEASTAPATVKLKDGTEVTLDELTNGYLRQSDYTRKTQAAAEIRRQVEARHAQTAQLETQLQTQLHQALQVAQATLPEPPDEALLNTDPIGYMQLKAAYDKRIGGINQLMGAYQQAQQRSYQAQAEGISQFRERQQQALVEKLPMLKDDTKRQAFRSDAVKYGGETYGYTQQELDSVIDSRAIHVLHDAVQWRKLQAQKPKADAKAKDAPQVGKPSARATPTEQDARVYNERMKKLRSTGRVEDAALALKGRI